MNPSDPSLVGSTGKHLPEPVPAGAGREVRTAPRHAAALSPAGEAGDQMLPTPIPVFPSLQNLLKAYKQCWLLATVAGLLLGGALGAGMWFLKPPQYTASALLRVASIEPTLLPAERAAAALNSEIYQRTQAALVKSPPVLKAALLKKAQDGRAIGDLDAVRLETDQITWLEDNLKVSFIEGTELMRLSMSGDKAQDLADMVNAVKEAYLQEVVNAERTDRVRRAEELDKVCLDAESNLKSQRMILRRLAEGLKASDPQVATQMQRVALEEYASLRSEQARLQVELRKAKVALVVRGGVPAEGQEVKLPEVKVPDWVVEQALEADPSVQEYRKKVAQVEQVIEQFQRDSAAGRISPRHERALQDVRDARAALDKRKAELRDEIYARLQKKMQQEALASQAETREKIRVLEGQYEDMKKEVERQQQRAQSLGKESLELELKRAEIDQAEALIKVVRAEKERLRMELQSTSQRVTKYHDAEPPKTKNIRSQIVRAAATAVWGLLLGIMGVAYREFRTGRVTGRDDLSASFRFQVFGALPALSGALARRRLRSRGTHGADLSLLFREAMDGVRTTLLHNETTESCRVLMVTSPGSREGKTTLAAHLAASIARAHRKVLLIDCDTRRACIHRLFELDREPGLSQVLKGELDLAEAVRPGTVEGLFVLTAGPFEPDGMNAASKKAIEKLFAKLRQEYDYIIVDSCPVLPVVDSLLVGVHVDGVILSVRPRVSQLPRLFDAYERLRGARIPVLGAVLNGVPASIYSYESHYLLPSGHEEQ